VDRHFASVGVAFAHDGFARRERRVGRLAWVREARNTEDFQLPVTVPCSDTASTSIGSTCSHTTTADSVLPGAVTESKRSIWQLGGIQLYDGGPDSQTETTADNGLFATQGVFVP
jgi:hypothetical protein